MEMNSLEVEFLVCMNYSLFVNGDSYDKYHKELANYAHATVVPQKTLPSFGDVYASEPEPMHPSLQQPQQQMQPGHQEPMSYSSPHSQGYFMQNHQQQQQQQQLPIPHDVSPEVASGHDYHHGSFPVAPPVSWTYSYGSCGEPAPVFSGNRFGNDVHTHSQYMQMPMHTQPIHDPAMNAGSDGPMFMMHAGAPFVHQHSYPFGPPQHPYVGMPAPAMYAQPTFYVPVGSR